MVLGREKVQVVTSESKRKKIQFGSSDTYLTIIQRQPLDDDDDANYNDDYNDNTKGGDDDDGFSDILLLETPCPFVGSLVRHVFYPHLTCTHTNLMCERAR